MRDLCSGKRKRINEADVKSINVPHLEGLKIERMLEFGYAYPEVKRALPSVRREVEKLPRQYVANVIFTIVGEPFKKWVEQRVDDRHEERRKQEDTIQMDPEIARIFQQSHATSGKKHYSVIA